jgi:hypothetical protein
VPVKKIYVRNATQENFQGVTVTDKQHVAGKPLRASADAGAAPIDLDMSGNGSTWQSSNLVLSLHGENDTNAVSLIDMKNKKAMVLTSSLARPLKVDVHYVPTLGHLTLTLKH